MTHTRQLSAALPSHRLGLALLLGLSTLADTGRGQDGGSVEPSLAPSTAFAAPASAPASAPATAVTSGATALPPDVDALLCAGDLADAERQLEAWCSAHPDDQLARFGLGWAQALGCLEGVGRDLHRHGARIDRFSWLGIVGLYPEALAEQLPAQPEPALTSHADLRTLLIRCEAGLSRAAATLATCDIGDQGLVLHPGRFATSLSTGTPPISFSRWLGLANPGDPSLEALEIRFDQADVQWLAGYCHALAAPLSVALAVDTRDLFEHAAHMVFPRTTQTLTFLADDQSDMNGVVDLIAAIHVARLPVTAPEHMTSALTHLEALLRHSRGMWARITAETDDDREWVPNAEQSGPLGVSLSAETIDTWRDVLADVERLVAGETLLPFWRGKDSSTWGVNLRRVFTEPTTLDPVLWLQGTAATPYLESGTVTPLSDGQLWRQLRTAFGGNPAVLALWVN